MSREQCRGEDRRALSLSAGFKYQHSQFTVDVSDISEHGCKIVLALPGLEAGSIVSLRLEDFECLYGTVAWVDGLEAGVAFEYALHSSVVDHLCRKHPTSSLEAMLGLAA